MIYTYAYVPEADFRACCRTAAVTVALMLCVSTAAAAGQAYHPGKPLLRSLEKFNSLLLCYFGQVRQAFLQNFI